MFARTLYMEARGSGRDGMRAVAHAIYNRFRKGLLTIAGVCMADQQFSCWNAARDDSNREKMNDLPMNDPILEQARVIVASIEVDEDPTGGATLYYAKSMVQPPNWALEGKTTFTVEIGGHRFYTEP